MTTVILPGLTSMDFVPPFWPRTPEEIRTRAPRGEGFTGRANLASRLNGPGHAASNLAVAGWLEVDVASDA